MTTFFILIKVQFYLLRNIFNALVLLVLPLTVTIKMILEKETH